MVLANVMGFGAATNECITADYAPFLNDKPKRVLPHPVAVIGRPTCPILAGG
jgi:hypothetical protein